MDERVWFALPLALIVAGVSADTLLLWFAIAGAQAALQGLVGRVP